MKLTRVSCKGIGGPDEEWFVYQFKKEKEDFEAFVNRVDKRLVVFYEGNSKRFTNEEMIELPVLLLKSNQRRNKKGLIKSGK